MRSVDGTDVGECCAELIARAGAWVLAQARAEIRVAEELRGGTQAWPHVAPRGRRR